MKRRLLNSFPVRAGRRYLSAGGGVWATVIAWNTFFAFFPIILVTVTLLSLVPRSPGLGATVESAVASAVGGGDATSAVNSALSAFHKHQGTLVIVSILSLMWSGSAFVGAFDQAFNALYPCKPRSFVAQKVMSVGVMLLFTLLTIPLILSSVILAHLEEIPGLPGFVRAQPATQALQAGLGVIDGSLLFAVIYFVVPYRRQAFRRVLRGALTAGILLEGITLLFPIYVRLSNNFQTYGKTFALLFLLLTYFYLFGQVAMIGATINAESDPDPGGCVEPSETTAEVRGAPALPAEAGTPAAAPGGRST